jgi:thioredoxin 1
MMKPVIEKVDNQMSDVMFMDINVDNNTDLATKYQISSIPAIVIEVDGKEVHRIVGACTEKMLIETIEKYKG